MSAEQRVAVVHDYVTQRGGAERVVLAMLRAFPDAPLYTSLYDPAGTFPAFASVDVRTQPIDRVALLRRHHRLALPLLAASFGRMRVDADVAVCSSTGWAHGAHVTGRKVVYCNTPARWLYQPDRYAGGSRVARAAITLLAPPLRRWDRAAAATAHRYVASSSAVRERVRQCYGVDAEVLPPAVTALTGEQHAVAGVEPGFLLCVSRLLPYKNVDAVVAAVSSLPSERLVVVGTGPDAERLGAMAGDNVTLLGTVDDAELRWLYANCAATLTASYEDFGLVPLEAASFGRPAATLRFGGFLDTIREGETGVFFESPTPEAVRAAVVALRARDWDEAALRAQAERFSESSFAARLQQIVAEEAAA